MGSVPSVRPAFAYPRTSTISTLTSEVFRSWDVSSQFALTAIHRLALEFNLELQYRKTFREVWEEEQNDPELGRLSERMGVRGEHRGPLLVSEGEMEAASK